jgi:hypothetical protein
MRKDLLPGANKFITEDFLYNHLRLQFLQFTKIQTIKVLLKMPSLSGLLWRRE